MRGSLLIGFALCTTVYALSVTAARDIGWPTVELEPILICGVANSIQATQIVKDNLTLLIMKL